MNRCTTFVQRLLLGLALATGLAAQADPVPRDVFFGGTGSLVFDAGSGTGAWLGQIDESAFPVVADPLALLSSVSFVFDGGSGLLTGTFEFTLASDFGSTLLGDISGQLLGGDFASGGQLSLNFSILDGTGQFNRASGFGLSLLDFAAPVGGFSDYSEAGVMTVSVPEPGALALVAAGLLLLAASRRRTGHLKSAA